MRLLVHFGIAQTLQRHGQTHLGQTRVQTQLLVEPQLMQRQVKSLSTRPLFNTPNSQPNAGTHIMVQVMQQL